MTVACRICDVPADLGAVALWMGCWTITDQSVAALGAESANVEAGDTNNAEANNTAPARRCGRQILMIVVLSKRVCRGNRNVQPEGDGRILSGARITPFAMASRPLDAVSS